MFNPELKEELRFPFAPNFEADKLPFPFPPGGFEIAEMARNYVESFRLEKSISYKHFSWSPEPVPLCD